MQKVIDQIEIIINIPAILIYFTAAGYGVSRPVDKQVSYNCYIIIIDLAKPESRASDNNNLTWLEPAIQSKTSASVWLVGNLKKIHVSSMSFKHDLAT